MKAKEKITPVFLTGGGVMGELIRSLDWSKTAIGSPDTWPQSLRIAVRIMLDCPFGMYIAWGNDYIQMYNDGYRPILGATKHPQALGISTRKTFEEIWSTIGPMFEGVMQGTPVGFSDFILHLDRNGYLEECVFDFSYSPIRLEDGEVGGVLVTVIETTEKVKAAKALKEGEKRFQNLIREANVGIVVLIGEEMRVDIVNEAYGRLVELSPDDLLDKPLFEVIPHAEEYFRPLLTKVRLTGESLYLYDQPYSIVTNGKKVEGFVNVVYQAYKEPDGTIVGVIALCQDVSETIKSRKKIEESEAKFRALAETIPHLVWTATPDGKKNFFNKYFLSYTGKTLDELKGDGWQNNVFPDDLKIELDRWRHSLLTGEDFKIEKRLRHHNGTYRWHLSHSIAQKDKQGNITGWIGTNTDVDEQKRDEEKIKESEAKFRTLSETIPIMVWTATSDGKKNFFNQYYLDYTGLSFEELKDDGMLKIIFPDDLEKDLRLWQHSLKTGEDFIMEKRLRHHDGTFRWHLSHAIAQKDIHGNIIGWIGSSTEIDEQKKFAEELEEKVIERTYQLHVQNETFKQAEESSMQGSYSFNLTTGKLSYSDNLYRLIGYKPNEFEPSLEEFNKYVHPDDKDYVTEAAQKVLQSKRADEWRYRMITKTGKVINIKGTGRVIESGDEKLLVGTLQDVTKDVLAAEVLVEKEDYLNQIISNAPDGVIVINEKSIITLWNPKTEEIFGWKAEEVLGLELSDTIIPSQYRKAHKEGMKRFLKIGEARILNKTLELTALNKEGKEFPISLTISQATQQGNKLFIAFLRDITLEKQNQEELIFKTKQLQEINQTLESKNIELENTNAELASFSYIASHDLQEPLRKIQTFSRRILEGEKFSEKSHDYFNRIIAAGERMQNLIVSLLEFSRTNTTELIFVPCDLNTIVEESKNELHLSILEKQATIEHANLPTINGVHIQLGQLFTNIIDNAIKYSRPKINPHIKITSSLIEGKIIEHPSADNQKEYYAIKIADNGIGFEKEYANKIFELFQRLHNKNEYSGTGIGLAIVKKILTNHNGFIVADGKLGIGSIFTFYIPTS